MFLVVYYGVSGPSGFPNAVRGSGYCSFPKFLWQPTARGSSTDSGGGSGGDRIWISKTEYFRNTDTWGRQKEIRVLETEFLIQNKMHASCSGGGSGTGGQRPDSPMPCFRKAIDYRIICVSEEPDGKYRTQQNLNG